MDISTRAFQVNDVEESVLANSAAAYNGNGNGNGHDNGHQTESAQQSFAEQSFADMLDNFDYTVPQQGEFLEGTIIRIDEDAIFVNVGAKRDAIIPHTDLDQLEEEQLTNLSTGDTVPVYVLRTPVGEQELIVSLFKGLQQQDWDWADSCLKSEEILELEVVGHNKGGLLVEFGRLRGFVPNSHVVDLRHVRNPSERKAFKDKSRNDTMFVKVIEVDRDRRRLVLSETAAMVEQRQKRMETLEEGSIMTGIVVNVVKYGAFVDLDGVHGLLHISKIDWQHIDHPSNVLSVGDEVEVMIDEVDVEKERVSLNRKVLMPTPWDAFAEEHAVGELIEGTITNVLDFGAFVQVADGIEGLIHISEINMPHSGSPEAVLQSGDVVLARIISIEPDRERLSLSLRRVTTSEELDWMARKAEAEASDVAGTEAEAETEVDVEAEAEAEAELAVEAETETEAEAEVEVETEAEAETAADEATAESEELVQNEVETAEPTAEVEVEGEVEEATEDESTAAAETEATDLPEAETEIEQEAVEA
jgi:small subunit ribosomal protein S1